MLVEVVVASGCRANLVHKRVQTSRCLIVVPFYTGLSAVLPICNSERKACHYVGMVEKEAAGRALIERGSLSMAAPDTVPV